jgi:hypothetical protein
MRIKIFIKPLDIIAIFTALLAAGTFSIYAYGSSQEGGMVIIKSSENEWVYPLDADKILQIEGPLGDTEIHISDGKAWVADSPCRDKICTSSAPISKSGQWIACMPNRIFIRVESADEAQVDATTF